VLRIGALPDRAIRFRSAIRWALTIAAVVAIGAIAAWYRLLDSWVALLALCVVVVAAVAYGVWATIQPWDDLDE
jgi:hypothetical protein